MATSVKLRSSFVKLGNHWAIVSPTLFCLLGLTVLGMSNLSEKNVLSNLRTSDKVAFSGELVIVLAHYRME